MWCEASLHTDTLIDWWRVAAHGLWIVGLAIALAVFSYHDWLAQHTARPRMTMLRRRSFRVGAAAGLILVGLGVALVLSIGG